MYKEDKDKADHRWELGVHEDIAIRPGGGGCTWEPGADIKTTARCVLTNPGRDEYIGYAQSPESPMYAGKPNWNPPRLPRNPKGVVAPKEGGKVAVAYQG